MKTRQDFLGDLRRTKWVALWDSHNGLKLLLDALEKAIYDNDRWALPRIQDWSIDKAQPRVEMEIYRGC